MPADAAAMPADAASREGEARMAASKPESEPETKAGPMADLTTALAMVSMGSHVSPGSIGFLHLPPEIREMIYCIMLTFNTPTPGHIYIRTRTWIPDLNGGVCGVAGPVAVMRTCRIIYEEARAVLYGFNVFRARWNHSIVPERVAAATVMGAGNFSLVRKVCARFIGPDRPERSTDTERRRYAVENLDWSWDIYRDNVEAIQHDDVDSDEGWGEDEMWPGYEGWAEYDVLEESLADGTVPVKVCPAGTHAQAALLRASGIIGPDPPPHSMPNRPSDERIAQARMVAAEYARCLYFDRRLWEDLSRLPALKTLHVEITKTTPLGWEGMLREGTRVLSGLELFEFGISIHPPALRMLQRFTGQPLLTADAVQCAVLNSFVGTLWMWKETCGADEKLEMDYRITPPDERNLARLHSQPEAEHGELAWLRMWVWRSGTWPDRLPSEVRPLKRPFVGPKGLSRSRKSRVWGGWEERMREAGLGARA